jgi:hypothetical protein
MISGNEIHSMMSADHLPFPLNSPIDRYHRGAQHQHAGTSQTNVGRTTTVAGPVSSSIVITIITPFGDPGSAAPGQDRRCKPHRKEGSMLRHRCLPHHRESAITM